MSRRLYMSRFPCAHPGCPEVANYESHTRSEQAETQRRYYGKWRCVRHSQPQEVLGPGNLLIVHEETSRQEPHGRYWGHSGFQYGPGFKAFAKDFPAGTVLRVTAEIILPDGPTAQAKTSDAPLSEQES